MENKTGNENFNEFGGVTKIGTIAKTLIENYEVAHNSKDGIIGIRTGFEQLDSIIQGLQRKNLILLCGRPGVGKSSFMVNVANNVCKNNHSVLYFSFGLSAAQLTRRALSNSCGLPSSAFEFGKLNDKDMEKIKEITNRDFYIYENVKISLSEFKSQCMKLKLANKLDLIIIDYIQCMCVEENKLRLGRFSYRDEDCEKVSVELKSLARDLNVPIVAVAPILRSDEDDKNTCKIDDSDSLNIFINDADVVLLMSPNTSCENYNYIDLHIAKNENGNTGKIKYKYDCSNIGYYEEKYQSN